MNNLEIIFFKVINISVYASLLIIIILLLRCILKKFPSKYLCILWMLIFIKLLLPIDIKTMFSLIPINSDSITYENIVNTNPHIDTGIDKLDTTINRAMFQFNNIQVSDQISEQDNISLIKQLSFAASIIWLLGIFIILLYSIIQWICMKRKLCTAVLIEPGIFETNEFHGPFLMGLLHPVIYVPTGLSEKEYEYVCIHERIHIARRDYLLKLTAFLAVSIYWFNPLVWISFKLLSKDIEIAVDEKVCHTTSIINRAEYAAILLNLSIRQSGFKIPVAFGENNTKNRVKHVINLKKHSRFIKVAAIVIIIIITVCFGTSKVKIKYISKQETVESDIDNDSSPANIHEMINKPFDEESTLSLPVKQDNNSDNLILTMEQLLLLFQNRTLYIGDNSKVFALSDALLTPDYLILDKIQLQTVDEPYKLTLFYNASINEDEIDENENLRLSEIIFMDSAIMFSVIENLSILDIKIYFKDSEDDYHWWYSYKKSDITHFINEEKQTDMYYWSETFEKLLELQDKVVNYLENGGDNRSDQDITMDLMEHMNNISVNDLDNAAGNIMNGESKDICLLASLEEEGIWLYGYNDEWHYGRGVFVRMKKGNYDYIKAYDWVYTSTSLIMPELIYEDYNGDGNKEIAAVFSYGTGTGVSVYRLYIIEIDENGQFSSYLFDEEDYTAQIENRISYTIDIDSGNIILYDYGEQLCIYNISGIETENDALNKIENIYVGNQVRYDINDQNIILDVYLSFRIAEIPYLLYFDDFTHLYFQVSYDSGSFTLTECISLYEHDSKN